jgi:hypothetical protein
MLLMVVVFVGGTWVGAVLVRPILRLFALKQTEWNGLVSAGLSCFGVFYGLLLGLLAVAAYQNFSEVDGYVSDEALILAGMYPQLKDAYPEPLESSKIGPSSEKGRFPALERRQFASFSTQSTRSNHRTKVNDCGIRR